MRQPGDGYNLNIHHSSNPFSSNSDTSWINTHGSTKRQTFTKDQDTVPQGPQHSPKLKVQISPVAQGAGSHSSSSLGNTVNRYTGHPGNEKAAPPIPRKPVSLSSKQCLTGSWPVTSTPQAVADTESILKESNPMGRNLGDKVNTVDISSTSTERLSGTGTLNGFWLDRREEHGQAKSSHTNPSFRSPRSTGEISDLLSGTGDETIEWEPLIPQ